MLLSSSNRKYPLFPLFSYFSVVVCLRSLLHHILSLIVYIFQENREFVFISIVQFMMSANSRIRFGLQIVYVCLYITPFHYHHCANFIWRTFEMHVRYNLSSVWVRLRICSQLSIIWYVGLCVFSLQIFFVMIERIYILCLIIVIKSEVWTITHCLGLGNETMVCAVCLSIFSLKWSVIWDAIWRSCDGHSKNTIYFHWLQNNRIYPSATFTGRRDVAVIQLGISVKQTRQIWGIW